MEIAVSILSMEEREKNIAKLANSSTSYIHLDVMDGRFVSNTVAFLSLKEAICKTKKPLDIHLMVKDVHQYIEMYQSFSPQYMTFPIEAVDNPTTYITKIKSFSKAGLAISPKTKVDNLLPYLKQLDLVLVMSVEPGKGGQTFIDITEKIQFLKGYRDRNNLSFKIEVDGGINATTISKVRDCDIVVVGSYITNHTNYEQQIRNLVN